MIIKVPAYAEIELDRFTQAEREAIIAILPDLLAERWRGISGVDALAFDVENVEELKKHKTLFLSYHRLDRVQAMKRLVKVIEKPEAKKSTSVHRRKLK